MKYLLICAIAALSIGFTSCLDNSNSFDANAQFKLDTTAIRDYLDLYGIYAIKSPYGVWYEVDQLGTGHYPSYADTIKVNYTGNILSTGAEFSKTTTNPFEFQLAGVIAGWQIGIPRLPVGTKGKLYIPSFYGYGATGGTNIPANSNLVFTIEIVSASGWKLQQDIKAIDQYIQTNNITNVIEDPSGLRYTIDNAGTGIKAIPSGYVTVNYTGKLLANGSTFVSVNTPTKLYLPSTITAWGIALPQIKEGSTVTLYVPAGLAYSIYPAENVPANSNLIYTITVSKVSQ